MEKADRDIWTLKRQEMDTSVSKLLADKLYDKRKAGALEYVLATTFSFTLGVGWTTAPDNDTAA